MIKKWQIILIWTLAACALLVAGTALAESTLTLPEDVTVIEEQAFWGTDAETIVVPAGVTSIGDGAFGGSARLHVVYVPDSLMDRETAALQGSPNARFVSLTQDWSTVFDYSVADSGVTITKYKGSDAAVVIPPRIEGVQVTVIGNGAFQGNKTITAVVIPEGVVEIGSGAFYDCNSLAEVTFPSTLRVLGGGAFAFCSYKNTASRYVLPDQLESIVCTGSNGDTFYNCDAVRVVTPGSATALLLSDLSHYATVNENAYKKQWFTFDGCDDCRYLYFTEDGAPVLYLMKYLGTAAEFSIPSAANVVPAVIADGAFRSCVTLAKVVIPNGVKIIDANAFYDCTALTDVTFPDSLHTLGRNAFTNCGSAFAGAFSFRLPDHITSISMSHSSVDTFYRCNALRIVTPGSDTAYLFSDSLQNPQNPEAAYPYHWFTFPGSLNEDLRYLYFLETVDGASVRVLHLIKYTGSDAQVTIPAQETGVPALGVIEAKAFQGNITITSLVLPDGITRFGRGAFAECSYLTDITFPQTLRTLEQNVFTGCGNGWYEQNREDQSQNYGEYIFNLPPDILEIVMDNSNLDSFYNCAATLHWAPDSNTAITFQNHGYQP